MNKVYACLVGQWVCLNDDENCTIGEYHKSPSVWWEEKAKIYAPSVRNQEIENSLYSLDYVHIYYNGNDYRINPIFIQIVNG